MSSGAKKLNINIIGTTQTHFSVVKKAFLQTNKININEEKFLFATIWMPKANPKYDKPQIVLKLQMIDDSIKVYFKTFFELEALVNNLNKLVEIHKDTLIEKLAKEQDNHDKLLKLISELEV